MNSTLLCSIAFLIRTRFNQCLLLTIAFIPTCFCGCDQDPVTSIQGEDVRPQNGPEELRSGQSNSTPQTTTKQTSDLSPVVFGAEQNAFYGIRSGTSFPSTDENGTRTGNVLVRGKQFKISRDDTHQPPKIALDLNQDGSFQATEYQSSSPATFTLTINGDEVLVEVFNHPEKSEHLVREIWESEFEYSGETIRFAAMQFSEGSIQYADNDSDGIYETYLTPDSPVSLGGRGWTLELDFEHRTAALTPTDQTPVQAGYLAPQVQVHVPNSGRQVPLITDGMVSVILFCHPSCFGCLQLSQPLTSLLQDFESKKVVRFYSVARNTNEMTGNRQSVCPGFEQVISEQAWKDYAVRPTPTIIVVDTKGQIIYRSVGSSPSTSQTVTQAIRMALKTSNR